ncbi:MAG: UDP-N-acetylmuramate:L-alanyl-gamma-D-glutamyl-meso-diaminopimelate ligase [Oligoflexus sp.]|nr:UDP-N-acetylmuramate:L-alanyl-gamma-D-glutamyl-meso-diaminopimelate ligase [Oligoflexus sp.]
MELKKGDRIYFMGIGGTGMASVAGLAQEAGYDVSGSDANLYPPMSTMLETLGIPVHTPYDAKNLEIAKPKLVVVANALSKNHVEIEALLKSGIPYTSFPAFLGDYFLGKRKSIVVAGTHGKTTTTSILTFVLLQIGWDPGYLIGGIPRDLPQSFALGKGSLFAIEGDEYDTAFFDKNSKFLHYRPKYLIFNNIEFDHADIFKDLAAIEKQFTDLLNLMPDKKAVIANVDDPGVEKLLNQLNMRDKVTAVATKGTSPDASVRLLQLSAPKTGEALWTLKVQLDDGQTAQLKTSLAGPHNAANICQVLACLWQIYKAGDAPDFPLAKISQAIEEFQGVQRRLDKLSSVGDIEVFEDFAHHPTAVKTVIEAMRAQYPDRRLLVAFDPKNATSRRSVFMKEFAKSLGLADCVFIGACTVDQRIPEAERMNTVEMARMIGGSATAFDDNEELLNSILKTAKTHDTILFMSSGSFSGIQYRIGDRLSAQINGV